VTAHVAPHRWADAWKGRLDKAEVAEMDRHAEACARCAKARDRITRASSSTFPAMRVQSSPELSWDAVRAKIHWSVSTERHQRLRPSRRPLAAAWVLAGGLVAAAVVTGSAREVAHERAVAVAPTSPQEIAPAPLAGLVSRLSGAVMIDGLRAGAFDRQLGPGAVIATGDGRIDVQFGDASALSLGPRSTVELRRFDADAIELAVEGTIDIAVAPRAPGQRFVVVAGDREIEVRGTQFRVVHEAGALVVACRHGLVAVRDAHGELEVGAARRLAVPSGRAVAGQAVAPLSADELAQLVQATPVTTPLWTDVAELARSSAALDIATVGRRSVRLDGVELGQAPLRVRVMPGRHTVEAADRAGRYHRAGWVDVKAGTPARLDVHTDVDAPPTASSAARRRELHAGIAAHRPQLARCTRALAKAGVTDTYVTIEISVDASGAVGFLNVLDSDLPNVDCVLEALRDVRFGAGSAATWREKIAL